MKENSAPQENNELQPDRFESDTQRIIHRHLENKNDVITDDDIRNVRIGQSPAAYEGYDDSDGTLNEEIADAESTEANSEDNPDQTENPVTSWDAMQR